MLPPLLASYRERQRAEPRTSPPFVIENRGSGSLTLAVRKLALAQTP
jgi:hypothetical protein